MNEIIQKLANKIRPIQVKLEMVLYALSGIGLLLRDTETGKLLSLISLGALSMLYFLMSFRLENPNNRFLVFLNKMIHLSFSIGVLGILFAVNHYPNAIEMLSIGFLSILFGLVGLLILKFRTKTDKRIADSDLIRAILIASILALLLVSGNVSDFRSFNPDKNAEKQELIEQ
jgi:hypothetical protein